MKFGILFLVASCAAPASAPGFTIDDGRTVSAYQKDVLDFCQGVGRTAGTFSAYAACVAEGGAGKDGAR